LFIAWLIMACAGGWVRAQGTFQNLGFEAATVPSLPPGQDGAAVLISNAFPGWVGSLGTNVQSQVLHNTLALGNAAISILGPNYYSDAILEGAYTAVLQTGLDPAHAGSLTPVAASLSQSGTIPLAARSIHFTVGVAAADFTVGFNGQPLGLILEGSTSTHQIFGADVTGVAGVSGQLLFTALPTRYPLYNTLRFDAIRFSDQWVPEPCVFTLSGLGALLLGWRRWRRGR
jgi:hypothetical protein